MNKIIFWNIRSVNSQQAFERMTNLNRRNQYWLICFMEPFQDSSNTKMYKKTLGHHTALANCSGKIWLFPREEPEISIVSDTTQHLGEKRSGLRYMQHVMLPQGRNMGFFSIYC